MVAMMTIATMVMQAGCIRGGCFADKQDVHYVQ